MNNRSRKLVRDIWAAVFIAGVSLIAYRVGAAPASSNLGHPFEAALVEHDQILARVSEPVDLCSGGTTVGRFVVNGTEVCDRTTGLYWQRTPPHRTQKVLGFTLDASQQSYNAAMTYCPTVGPNYRLPEVEELISLVDYSQFAPALPAGHPFTDVGLAYYWSATTNAAHQSRVWVVDFEHGFVDDKRGSKDGHFRVWCVRDAYVERH